MKKRYRKPRKEKKITLVAGVGLLILTILGIGALQIHNMTTTDSSRKCSTLTGNNFQSLTGELKTKICYQFYANSGQIFNLSSNNKITLLTPNGSNISLQGSSKTILPDTGNYSIIINTDSEVKAYQMTLQLENNLKNNSIDNNPTHTVKLIDPNFARQQSSNYNENWSYNVVTDPPFKTNQKLQIIVNSIVSFVQSRGLPVDRLSVSLVDLNSSECCAYASHFDRELRFPASVVKLFWMVALYGQYKAGVLEETPVLEQNLYKMIKDSHNPSASFIVDRITKTESGDNLPPEQLKDWIGRRYSLNSFFEKSGYSPINISQKSFPLDYIKNDPPLGRDLQIRGNEITPYRNYVTTYSLARLLFEIYTKKSISKEYSNKMKSLLTRDLHPDAWKNHDFNPIEGFLGEGLPPNALFMSKMGWTFKNRNDAAIVVSPDQKTQYILVIFGDDASFYKDKKIYPDISRMVYEQMRN